LTLLTGPHVTPDTPLLDRKLVSFGGPAMLARRVRSIVMSVESNTRSTNRIRLAAAVVLACACGSGPNEPPGNLQTDLALEVVASNLNQPIDLTAPPGDQRLFVAEQVGRVRIIEGGQLVATPFLDITNDVACCGEEGLLGITFHPNYASNGFFYVSYTHNNGDSRVDRFTVSADPNVADAGSRLTILGIQQPFSNHNGGQIVFGSDGMLYLSLGDGGSGNDPLDSGQHPDTWLGSILRLDVDGGSPYAIPADNPFVTSGNGAPEVWAYGLRNPWRFSFDRTEGVIYIADVGQGAWEEINAQDAGLAPVNYGWKIMEGTHCRPGGPTNCNQTGLTLPVIEYVNDGASCAVVGGFVYRGSAIPEIVGHYFYSDFCGGWLRSFRYAGGSVSNETSWDVGSFGNPRGFGEDANKELYILADANVLRLIKSN
jgi:glucose/arabinose dehydrogenase